MSDSVSDPLARPAAAAGHGAASNRRRASDASCVPGSIGEEHSHLVDVHAANCSARVRVLPPLPVDGRAEATSPCPTGTLRSRIFRRSAAVGQPSDPVSVAFFLLNSTLDRVARSTPVRRVRRIRCSARHVGRIVAANPSLAGLEPDVEAFLVRADRNVGGAECFVVPIDVCYELVGRLRMLWRGFDGGREAHAALDEFFERVRTKAR